MADAGEAALLERAKFGDRQAFDALVGPHLGKIRGLLRRMVGHPEDCEDLLQDVLLQAYTKIGTFRGGSAFSTWLHTIASRKAIDHLRAQKRWAWDAQDTVRQSMHADSATERALNTIIESPNHRFEAREHIAFCFTCVGRSLEPQAQAAIVLRDVFEYKNDEAAKMMGMSLSVFRHLLSAARAEMQSHFEGLCGLINKDGVCHQCKGLRDRLPGPRQGGPLPTLDREQGGYQSRLPIVRDANINSGELQGFHDFVWRALKQ